MTHTFVTLGVSAQAFAEIAGKLRAAGYEHAFVDEAIDMHGIGLVESAFKAPAHLADTPRMDAALRNAPPHPLDQPGKRYLMTPSPDLLDAGQRLERELNATQKRVAELGEKT